MTSMRKLKRRLLRWQRYGARTGWRLGSRWGVQVGTVTAYDRARNAVEAERFRRQYGMPSGCTGYIREDLDWGELLTHARPCPVHGGAR